jgi:hypothetical protein
MSQEFRSSFLKKSFLEILPESLYQQIEPYCDRIQTHYQEKYYIWRKLEEKE